MMITLYQYEGLMARFLMTLLLCIGAIVSSAAHALSAQQSSPDKLIEKLQQAANEQDANQWHQKILQSWSRSDNASAQLLYQRALKSVAVGQNSLAMDLLDTALVLDPDYFQARNVRATLHFYSGDLNKSLIDVAHVLALEPRHYGALSGMGLIFIQLGQDDNALLAFEKALAIHPFINGVKREAEKLRAKQIDQAL
jgi:Tfp pilus assembly protein PilF